MTDVIEQVAKLLYGIGPSDDWPKVLLETKVSYRRKARGFITTAIALQNIHAVFPEATVISSDA